MLKACETCHVTVLLTVLKAIVYIMVCVLLKVD